MKDLHVTLTIILVFVCVSLSLSLVAESDLNETLVNKVWKLESNSDFYLTIAESNARAACESESKASSLQQIIDDLSEENKTKDKLIEIQNMRILKLQEGETP